MSLLASNEAVGAVSELLQNLLLQKTKVHPTVGRPEDAGKAPPLGGGSSFNLFLYRVSIDSELRNRPLDPGQAPPLWLVLHYLLTAFDGKESDSINAHKLLGRGLLALHSSSIIRPDSSNAVLAASPDPLRLSFEEADAELLSKIMQGSDEKYRVSAAFQVRPVMLASVDEPPSYALPVKTIGQPTVPPDPRPYTGPVVFGSLGARVTALEPERFAAGQALVVRGMDLAGYDQIQIGANSYPATATGDGGLSTTIPAADPIAAGAYPVAVARAIDADHSWSSNALGGHLLPTVAGVALAGSLSPSVSDPARLKGRFTVTGAQLGGPDGAIYAALYRDGKSQVLAEALAGGSDTALTFELGDTQALPAGIYKLILRVNGEQALQTPDLDWS